MGSELHRTHHCNELTEAEVNRVVILNGWVNSIRDLGGLVFIDLRDREGITQLFIDPARRPDLMDRVREIREEWVIAAAGTVRPRPSGMVNPARRSGAIEIDVHALEILNRAKPMPFNLDDPSVSEDLRLKYRYLDMRRSKLLGNLRLRHRLCKTVRDVLDRKGFIEVETPILSKSTPEGARDYLVPSRVHPGCFYALPQAPQQYKQLLMVGGVERYFQIAKCFRDEDLRADRQPEFTQIDMEMSFVTRDDVLEVVEEMLTTVMKELVGVEIPRPFPRLTHADAMSRFGSDKPDTRFGMELLDLSDVLGGTSFRVFQGVLGAGGIIKAINAKGMADRNRRQLDQWTETVKRFGAKGLAWLKLDPAGGMSGTVAKFLDEEERNAIVETTGAEPGDLLLIVADKPKTANEALGRLRLEVAEAAGIVPRDAHAFLWVIEFPLFEFDSENKRYVAVHHPFTSPCDEDLEKLREDPGKVQAQAYDVVLNGVELGGGSVRIHRPEQQQAMFGILGIEEAEARSRFGHLLEALSLGAPPHAGIALGLDRFAMLLAGADSIRDVIAYPKTTKASCLMTQSPSGVDAEQLTELHIRTAPEPEAPGND